MKVICISGQARHGKDTLAGYLAEYMENHGQRVRIMHYGDYLKYICREYFDWDGQKDEKGRQLLQYVGTDLVRAKIPDFWARNLVDVLELFEDKWDYVLIPDCRFKNELTLISERFPMRHIRIYRPEFDNGLTLEQKRHPSETELLECPCDWFVMNDSDLASLRNKVIKCCGYFF